MSMLPGDEEITDLFINGQVDTCDSGGFKKAGSKALVDPPNALLPKGQQQTVHHAPVASDLPKADPGCLKPLHL